MPENMDLDLAAAGSAVAQAQQVADIMTGIIDKVEAAYMRMYSETVSHTHHVVEESMGNNTAISIAVVAMLQSLHTAANLRDYELARSFQAVESQFRLVADAVAQLCPPGGRAHMLPPPQESPPPRSLLPFGAALTTCQPREPTRYSRVLHESIQKMFDKLPPSHRTLLDTIVTQSAFCPSIMALHGVHHPLATIYSTRLDTAWDPLRTMVFSNPAFLGQTLIAESCRYQSAHTDDVTDAPLQHLVTVVHLMAKMGFGPMDLEQLAPVFDQTFARRVRSSAEGLRYLESTIVKTYCYPAVFRELIRRFFAAQQLGCGIQDTFRKDRGTRDEVALVLAWMRNFEHQLVSGGKLPHPGGRVTLLWGLQQKIDAAATDPDSWFPSSAPTPWHRITLVENAFHRALRDIDAGQALVDTITADGSPVWQLRAYPVVLRMHLVTHIKELNWNLKILPPTPEMFLHTGILRTSHDNEADKVTAALQAWFANNPWLVATSGDNQSFRDILRERGLDVAYAQYISDASSEAEERDRERRNVKRRSGAPRLPPQAAKAQAALSFVRQYREYNEGSFASYLEDNCIPGQVQETDSVELESRIRQFGDILSSVAAKSDHCVYDEARRHNRNFTALADLSMLQTTAAMWGLHQRPARPNETPTNIVDAMAQASEAVSDTLTDAHMDPLDARMGTASVRPTLHTKTQRP